MTFRLAVLAGGYSRRMGFDKATLRIHGEPVLTRLIERLGSPLGAPWILCRKEQQLNVPTGAIALHDTAPGDGPLVALAALSRLAHVGPVLVVPCDMPDLPPTLGVVLATAQSQTGSDAVLCSVRGRREALPVLVMPRAFTAVSRAVSREARRADAWHEAVNLHEIAAETAWGDDAPRLFRNDNYPSDLQHGSR